MGWFRKKGPSFEGFTLEERRKLLTIGSSELEQKRRAGQVTLTTIDLTGKSALLERLSDEELDAVIEIQRLTRQADATTGPKAIALYKKVLKLAPWDEISMMSIGVEYANAGKMPLAIGWLEKAAKANPDNDRVRRNLEGVRAAAR